MGKSKCLTNATSTTAITNCVEICPDHGIKLPDAREYLRMLPLTNVPVQEQFELVTPYGQASSN